jgi:hypothetical protein
MKQNGRETVGMKGNNEKNEKLTFGLAVVTL